MKAYLTAVAVGCVILSFAELIAPEGKTKNCVVGVFSLAFAAIALSVFVKNDKGEIAFPTFSYENTLNVDETTENYLNGIYCDAYSSDLKNRLIEIDLIPEKVNVEYCRGEIKKIEIYLSNLVIPDDNVHINNNVIADYISERTAIDREILFVYG